MVISLFEVKATVGKVIVMTKTPLLSVTTLIQITRDAISCESYYKSDCCDGCGAHYVITYPNGWTVSIVTDWYMLESEYDANISLWEAKIWKEGDETNDEDFLAGNLPSFITQAYEDVHGWMDEDDVVKFCNAVSRLSLTWYIKEVTEDWWTL